MGGGGGRGGGGVRACVCVCVWEGDVRVSVCQWVCSEAKDSMTRPT